MKVLDWINENFINPGNRGVIRELACIGCGHVLTDDNWNVIPGWQSTADRDTADRFVMTFFCSGCLPNAATVAPQHGARHIPAEGP